MERVLPRAATALWLGEPAWPPLWTAPATPAPAAVAPPERGPARLDLHGVSFAYGRRPLLRNISLRVRPGEVVAVTGGSGCGKTTLLRLAVGLLQPTAGRILVNGCPSDGCRRRTAIRHVAYLPQDPGAVLLADSVSQELEITLHARGLPPLDGSQSAFLSRLGLNGLENAYPRDLSTGQRLRVALGAVVVGDPALLVLDEPTRGLDDKAAEDLGGILRGLAEQGTGVLLASHDVRVLRHAHRTLRLAGGHLRPWPMASRPTASFPTRPGRRRAESPRL
jgi:energy-coupling factor transport system ATP-binding protein